MDNRYLAIIGALALVSVSAGAGFFVGESVGFDRGYENGYAVGNESGYNSGYDTGMVDGYHCGAWDTVRLVWASLGNSLSEVKEDFGPRPSYCEKNLIDSGELELDINGSGN